MADTDATTFAHRVLRRQYRRGAALIAAARLEQSIGAVVSRGGRPDAGALLPKVLAPRCSSSGA